LARFVSGVDFKLDHYGFRDDKNSGKNAWGGEYASFLLRSSYDEYSEGKLTFYFVMSTWNPYQVVQMKTSSAEPSGGSAF
jgi:predicted choloylglycine hydrolase